MTRLEGAFGALYSPCFVTKKSNNVAYIDAIYDAGGRVYEVGGAVRDRFLRRPSKDADLLVTGIPAADLEKLLRRFGSVHRVGASFGVLKLVPVGHQGDPIDVALPRTERSTGPGHRDFEVLFDHTLPVEEDLGRRDFTINAMALEVRTDELIDPFGGKADLEARVLRMVFDRAFVEDPLRILRGAQFTARLNLTVDDATRAAMEASVDGLADVSAERITTELVKLLHAEKPSVGFYLLRDIGALRRIMPELDELTGVPQPSKKEVGDAFDHTMKVIDAARADQALEHPGDLTLMLAALFHDVGKAKTRRYHDELGRIVFHGHQFVSKRMAKKRMKALRIETAGVKPAEILTLVENHMFDTGPQFTDKALRRFARKIGLELVFKQIDLRIADNRGGAHPKNIGKHLALRKRIREELNKKPPFGPKDLAINGQDLMEHGYPEGPAIGKKLRELVELVLDQPELNTREELLKRI